MSDHRPSAKGRSQTTVSVLLWLGVALILVLPFALFLNGLWVAQRQYRINRTYVPVEAKVLSAQVGSFKSSRGAVYYVPEVRYQYVVEDKTYQSETLAPLPASGEKAWAESIVSRYKSGETCRAFHDPQDPSHAILIRRSSFVPYGQMLEMVLVMAFGSFLVLRMWGSRRHEPAAAENGWFEIEPEFGERQRLFTAKVCTWTWYGLGAVPAAHFFLCLQPPYNHPAVVCFAGFGLLGLIPLVLLIRYVLMNRNLAEARLLAAKPVAYLGRQERFTLLQCARRQVEIKHLRVQLLCIGTKGQGKSRVRRTLYEATPVELKDRTLHAGESLELRGELAPPAEQRPSGRGAAGEFNQIDWLIRMDCTLPHAPDYTASFPLLVQAPPEQESEVPEAAKPGATVEVRPVDSRFAGRILTKRNIAIENLVGLLPLLGMLAGLGMMAVAYPVVFPGDKDFPRLLEVTRSAAKALFAGGAALTTITTLYGLVFPSLLASQYLHWIARRMLGRRVDVIVQPGAESIFVEIIPRANWNRLMLENAADIGYLTVDEHRREIRFEGDKERYRIPADALRSCELEKSFYTSAAQAKAPGICLAVIRAYSTNGIWEAPIAPYLITGRVVSKAQERAAQELQVKIKALLPATQANIHVSL